MAKMFYTMEEVLEKLGKTEDEVKEMVSSSQIQEFRDRDRLMFKVEQIDLLTGGDEDTGDVTIDLEDSAVAGGSGIDLQTDSALGLEESREGTGTGTGLSVFDTDHGAEDAGDATHLGDAAVEEEELSLDAVGSGSGLLDLTRESDETSLGAELLEEVYSGDENVEIPAHASGLFEAAGAESPGNAVTATAAAPADMGSVPMLVESYDGAGSGMGVGMLIAALASLILVALVVIVGVTGATSHFATIASSTMTSVYIWGGGLFLAALLLGLIGHFWGRATE